jgi:hypothetical protein
MMFLPADHGKYCDAKCKKPYDKARNRQPQQLQTKEQEEQDHTPSSD